MPAGAPYGNKELNYEIRKLSTIKRNPDNPRIIKDDKYKKLVQSIIDFPEMLDIRPIVINSDNMVLGGNMRLKACKEAGLKEVPIIQASQLTEEQQKEFIIKDNVGFGEWDWENLANNWDSEKIEDWGLDIPGFELDENEYGEDFSLKEGDRSGFQQMTFTLADEQVEHIKTAITYVKGTEDYKYCETFGNENSNGNALYLIIAQWEGQRK